MFVKYLNENDEDQAHLICFHYLNENKCFTQKTMKKCTMHLSQRHANGLLHGTKLLNFMKALRSIADLVIISRIREGKI